MKRAINDTPADTRALKSRKVKALQSVIDKSELRGIKTTPHQFFAQATNIRYIKTGAQAASKWGK